MVGDILFYESGPQKSLKTLEDSPLLVLISGLDLVRFYLIEYRVVYSNINSFCMQSSSDGLSMSLELFQHWLFGNIDGYGSGSDWESASIVRVIVAGNVVYWLLKKTDLCYFGPARQLDPNNTGSQRENSSNSCS